MHISAELGNVISINDLSSEEGSGTEQATSKVESPIVAMTTQNSRHGTTPHVRSGQMFLRLVDIVGILQREECKRARKFSNERSINLKDKDEHTVFHIIIINLNRNHHHHQIQLD